MTHNLCDKQATERAVSYEARHSMKQKRQVMKSKYLLTIASPCSHDNSLSITTRGQDEYCREAPFDEQSHFFQKERHHACQCSTVNEESYR
jgi:hypothetical protein